MEAGDGEGVGGARVGRGNRPSVPQPVDQDRRPAGGFGASVREQWRVGSHRPPAR